MPSPPLPPAIEAAEAGPVSGPVASPVSGPVSDPSLAGADGAPPPPPPAPPRRRPLLAWLRRPAEYARAYLTASVSHQLELQAGRLAEQAARTAELRHVAEATAGLVGERLVRAADRTADDLDALRHEVASLQLRLDRLEGRAAALGRTGDHHSELLERQHRLEARTAGQVDAVMGILGPRFDELEIKVRPLVPYDEASLAVRVADGYLLLPRSEPLFTVMVANAGSGGLEPGVRRVIRALLRPGMRAADVGANVGLLTLAMAAAVGPSGRVRAFEPEARVRDQLAKTLHLNGLAQVSLSAAAVGAEAGRIVFHESPVIGHSSLYALPDEERAGERRVEVEVVALDDMVPAGEGLDLVKIDVEGAELDVLRGMRRILERGDDIAVLAEFGPSHLRRVGLDPDAWFAAFAAHGLRPHLIGEPDGRVAPAAVEALRHVESANIVWTRPGGAADGRLPR